MQRTIVKSRILTPVLVLAAVVALALVLLFTLRGKADEPAGEFADFSYQTLSALNLAGDTKTDLRFLFTIGSLEYDEVGFVFSKTNDTPTVGGYGCGKQAATKVYRSVTANGTPKEAPNGRWWVAVKLTNIPHEYFDGAFYARPYVKDGEGVRYGEATSITVCSAAGHVHDSQLFPGCEGCELEDAKADIDFYNSSDKAEGNWNVSKTYLKIRGDNRFYPYNSNDMQGNDLLIEFSILWNETLTSGEGTALNIGVWDNYGVADLHLKGDYPGTIAARERDGIQYIYPTPEAIEDDSTLKYVSLGGYGWHRIGVRVHQEAAIVNDAVKYTYIITVYLDGEMVLKYDLSAWATANSGARLFTLNKNGTYSSNDGPENNRYKADLTIDNFYKGSKTYLPIADAYMTCGKHFVQDVVRDEAPEAATLALSGNDGLHAERWFERKGWKNETFLNANEKDSGTWDVRPTFNSIRGGEHFYPDPSNGNLGNDLLIEFSILWNDTLATAYNNFDIGVNDGSDIANINFKGGNANTITAAEKGGTTYIYPTPAAIAADSSAKCPNIGSNGWHRIGVRVHQEAAIVENAVKYTYIITVYLDGEMVLKYDSTEWATSVSGALLFTAEIVDGNLVYSDNANASAKANTTIVNYYKGSNNYLVIADQYMTCGKEFVRQVKPVAHPTATTDPSVTGVALPATTWYARASGPITTGVYTHTGFRSFGNVTVMNYNIESYDHGSAERTQAKVFDTITEISPDIVGLEEVDSDWNSAIESNLVSNGYARIQGDTSVPNWPELFYKTERFNNLDSDYERYSDLESEFSGVPKNGADTGLDTVGKMFTWARLEEKNTGKKILAISTHLHYGGTGSGHEEDDKVRDYEIRLLLAWIEAQTFDYDAVVIVGDMNAHYLSGAGKTTVAIFKEGGFAVTRDVAAIKEDVGGTSTASGRTVREKYVFDYVLAKGNVETVYYSVIDNKIDKDGTAYPSDHVPVVTEFRFR